MDKRTLLLVGGAVLLIGIVLGMEMFSWSPAPERRARGVPKPGVLIGHEPPTAKRSRITFGDLLGLMMAKASNPATREFAEEFQKTESLRTAWEDFRETDNADAFVRTLQEDGAFAELVERYDERPEFRDAAEDLANEPGMEEIVRKLMSERRPVVVVRKKETLVPVRGTTEDSPESPRKAYAVETAAQTPQARRTMRPVSGQGPAPVQGAVTTKPPVRYERPGAYIDELKPIPAIQGKPLTLENLGVDPAQIPQLPQVPQAGAGGKSEPFTSLFQKSQGADKDRRQEKAPKR